MVLAVQGPDQSCCEAIFVGVFHKFRLDKSSIPGFWDILSFEKERLPRRLACSDMNILPKLIWKILNKISLLLSFWNQNHYSGEKKNIFWQNFLLDIFDAILLEICKTWPMDAFHHFLMEFPALPWCALPFSYFFYSIFSFLTAFYLHSVRDHHFRIWTHRQSWGVFTHQTPSKLVLKSPMK